MISKTLPIDSTRRGRLKGNLLTLALGIGFSLPTWADTTTTTAVAPGITYRHHTYSSMFSSQQDVYVADIDLNVQGIGVKFPYMNGNPGKTVSAFAGTVSGALVAVNGGFFDNSTHAIIHPLKVNGSWINTSGGDMALAVMNTTGEIGMVPKTPGATGSRQWTDPYFNQFSSLMALGLENIDGDWWTSTDLLHTTRHPRTLAAWTENNHLLLFAVDGERAAAAGMTGPEFQNYLTAYASFWCDSTVIDAINFDGGGSTTFWRTGAGVCNHPSDGVERPVSDAIVVTYTTPVVPVGPVDAVSLDASLINVVVRGGANAIYWKYYDANGWSPYYNLGGNALSGPTICSWGPGRLDAFYTTTAKTLGHFFNNGVWGGPSDEVGPPGGIVGGPDAVSWGPNRLDIVARGVNNHIYQKYFNGTWGGWIDKGGTAASDPTICSWASGRLDVFYRTSGNSLGHIYYTGSVWGGPIDEGAPAGGLTSAPDAVSWGPSRIDIVARAGGNGNHIYHKYFNGTWGGWEDLGAPAGGATSDPSISSRGSGRLDVWVRGSDNALKHLWFDANGWSVWENLGGGLQ